MSSRFSTSDAQDASPAPTAPATGTPSSPPAFEGGPPRPAADPAATSGEGPRPSHTIEVFYDGECPLCRREISWLQRRDRQGRILFTNIAADSFRAESYGTTYAALMARIHGRLPDGRWIQGVEVFRRVYSAVGFGPLVWLTRLPLISQLLGLGYRLFASQRLRLTGRCDAGRCKLDG